jgi:hypothetical protein
MAAQIKQEHIIAQISKPTLVLDDIVVQDTESGAESTGAKDTIEYPVKYSHMQGSATPFIQINDFLYRDADIVNLTITTTGFLPTISVKFLVRSKIPYTAGFPTDGDLMSVFIRSKDDGLKPIRNDYEITSVRVDSSGAENQYDTMEISGILYVPGIKDMRCVSYTGTSLEVLQRIAEDLHLGFATNEVTTKDKQTWINPFRSMQEFITEIAESAWKDEKSFFTCFIDIFYHLNFVNVDPLFSVNPGMEMGISIEDFSQDYDVDSELVKSFQDIVFTNNAQIKYGSFHVKKYEQVNKANQVNRTQGYVKYNHYYDSLLRKKLMFFNDPLTSPNSESSSFIMKGRKATDQRFEKVTHYWMGTMYGENGENQHSKYIYAKTWNFQNMIHLDKLFLNIKLEQANMNLRRYQVIPLLITVEEDNDRRKYNQPSDNTNAITPATENTPNSVSTAISEEDLPWVIEKFYTGNYVTQSIEYVYERGKFTSSVKLLRREWPASPQLTRNQT